MSFVRIVGLKLSWDFRLFFLFFRCNDPLKCWPKGLGPNVFKCQIGQECDPQRLIKLAKMEEKGVVFSEGEHYFVDCENNGQSRYVCFADGYDVCNRCAEDVLSTRSSAMTASTLNKTSSAASHGSHASSKQLNGGWFDVQLKTISHQVEEKTNASASVRNGKVTTLVQEKDGWSTWSLKHEASRMSFFAQDIIGSQLCNFSAQKFKLLTKYITNESRLRESLLQSSAFIYTTKNTKKLERFVHAGNFGVSVSGIRYRSH